MGFDRRAVFAKVATTREASGGKLNSDLSQVGRVGVGPRCDGVIVG